MKTTQLLVCVGVVSLTACASMTGLDNKTDFACKAPDGILCSSMAGVYANAEKSNLPGQMANRKTPAQGQGQGQEISHAKLLAMQAGVMTVPIHSGVPIRTAPKVLRLWVAPWEDADGDLHDQNYVYLPVNGGRWLIEHNRRRISEAYQPVYEGGKGRSEDSKAVVPAGQTSDAKMMEQINAVQGVRK